ncbi:cytochrome P450 [Lophiotrema nucula]|uniref:Cytochrome P450 n=1 Tax=Lophiotrema nucula TaxID=690887 RepID=A0A6A5ZU74_9PLEO|nr:cytochrome P450 [Lophiotrema nucula]
MELDTSTTRLSLVQNIWVQTMLALIIILFSTKLWSEYSFNATKIAKASGLLPPTIPYWIPYLRHAFPMASDLKRFAAKVLYENQDGTPVFLQAAHEKILFLTNPQHVKRVLESAVELDPTPFVNERIMGRLMGSPKSAVDFYMSGDDRADFAQTVQMRQHLTGLSLGFMTKKLFQAFRTNVSNLLGAYADGTWVDISDLYAFIEDQLTRAIVETLMGSAFLEGYPEMVADLWTHIEATDHFFKGLPRILMPTAFAARDRLLSHLMSYSEKVERFQGEKGHSSAAEWDSVAGSALLQDREALFSSMPGHGQEGRAAQSLGLVYGGTSLTVPITFWCILETLKDPKLLQRVQGELERFHEGGNEHYNFAQLTCRPLLQSLHAEVTRFRSSNLIVRLNLVPKFALDDKYTIDKGTLCMMAAKPLGQFTESWIKAKPHTVSQPLDTFWADRFLQSDKFNVAGLTGYWTSFGGGKHMCPGRHFARNIAIVTMAVLLSDFECELVDVEAAKRTNPPQKETAFGTVKPTATIAARIRKRSA